MTVKYDSEADAVYIYLADRSDLERIGHTVPVDPAEIEGGQIPLRAADPWLRDSRG